MLGRFITQQGRTLLLTVAVMLAVGAWTTGARAQTGDGGEDTDSVTITWNANGGTPALTSVKVERGDSIRIKDPLPGVDKEGYTVEGWYRDTLVPSSKLELPIAVTTDMTFYAKWKLNNYTITWIPDGGAPTPTQRDVDHGGIITEPAAMTKTGYTFDKWYSDKNKTIAVPFPITSVTSGADLTFYANWTLDTYQVKWNPDGGTPAPTPAIVNHGGNISEPAAMTKKGYTFDKWYSDKDKKIEAKFPITDVTSGWEFFANWTPTPYNIVYQTNGGNITVSHAESYTILSATITLPTAASVVRNNNTFEGWYDKQSDGNKVTSIVAGETGDKTFWAKWTPNTYTITFNPNGGTLTPSQLTGTTGSEWKLTSLPTPTRTGYEFIGWFTPDIGGTEVTLSTTFGENTAVYAHWKIINYTVTFNVNGGNPLTPSTATTGEGWKLASLPEPTRANYTFKGWFTAAAGGTEVTKDRVYSNNTTTIYAQWNFIPYTVTFDANYTGGTVTPPSGVTGDGGTLPTASLPPQLQRAGYKFEGWFTAATAGTKVEDNKKYTENTTIYAHWTLNKYTVTFNVRANSGSAAVSPASGTTNNSWKLDSLPTPVRNSNSGEYLFSGWYRSSTDTSASMRVTIDRVYSGNDTIYAQWTEKSYTIKFNANGTGGVVAVDSLKTGSGWRLAALPAAPTRTGYIFSNWYFSATVKDTQVTTSTVFKADKIVYAHWTAASASPVVTFDPDSGAVNPTFATIGADGKISELPTPTRKGYSFAGWFTAKTGGQAVTIDREYTGATTIYARWTLSAYTISFNINYAGGTNPANATTGTAAATRWRLASLPAPTRAGYTLSGWYTEASGGDQVTTSTEFYANDTIFARWALVTYTVTFNVNSGSGTVNPGSAVTGEGQKLASLPVPQRSGYAFGGWFDTRNATGGAEITTATVFRANDTVYARWAVGTYTVKFNPNGGTVTPDSGMTGADRRLATLPTPARGGYTFNGWFTAATGGSVVTAGATGTEFRARDTIFAQWTLITYTIKFDANGGTVSTASAVTGTGQKLASLPTAAMAGYSLSGWFTALTGGTQVTTATVFSDSATIYARWALSVYTVKFNAGGGTVSPDSGTTGADRKLASLPTPTRAGYTFTGWFSAASGGTAVTADRVYSANAVIYAQWSIVAYTVTFNANGGAVSPESGTTGAGWKLAFFPTPTREGNIFTGWFTADTGGTQATTATAFTANSTVMARWTPISGAAAVVFDANGGTVSPAYAAIGADGKLASLPDPTARDGYVFDGWFTAKSGGTRVTASTTFDKAATVYARWTAVTVTNITGIPPEIAVNEPYLLTGAVVPADAANQAITWSVKDAGATGAKIIVGVFFATGEGDAVIKAVIANGKAGGADYEQEFTVKVVPFVSVASPGRVVPPANRNAEAAVTPVTPLTSGLTAGPNPALKSSGAVNFFRQGGRIESAQLLIYDATGNAVNKIAVNDNNAPLKTGKRLVGTWNLTDKKGNPVPTGTYLVKGVIKTAGGKREKVSVAVGVR